MASPGALAPNDPFIQYISRLQDLVPGTASTRGANIEVMTHIRTILYSDLKWKIISGNTQNPVYEARLWFNKIVDVTAFSDPLWAGAQLRTPHLFATMNIVFINGTTSPTAIDNGDAAGWAGDLFTFYAEWRRDLRKNRTDGTTVKGKDYCNDNLAKPGVETTFKILDLIEDVDGFLLAQTMRADSSLTILDAVTRFYVTGGRWKTRFQQFFALRLGGSAATARDLARSALSGSHTLIVTKGRNELITSSLQRWKAPVDKQLPHEIPPEDLLDFCQGFGNVMQQRVADEAALVAVLPPTP